MGAHLIAVFSRSHCCLACLWFLISCVVTSRTEAPGLRADGQHPRAGRGVGVAVLGIAMAAA